MKKRIFIFIDSIYNIIDGFAIDVIDVDGFEYILGFLIFTKFFGFIAPIYVTLCVSFAILCFFISKKSNKNFIKKYLFCGLGGILLGCL